MFKKTPKTETDIQELIDTAQTHLFTLEPDTEEYDAVLKQIERLYKLKSQSSEGRKVSLDTLLIVGGNLAGILIIVSYEHLHPIASKAVGFVLKSKV